VCALALLRPAAYGQRGFTTEFAAWEDPSIMMVTGKVVQVTLPHQSLFPDPEPDRKAYYDFVVSEWLKPRGSGLPQRITIAETWAALSSEPDCKEARDKITGKETRTGWRNLPR